MNNNEIKITDRIYTKQAAEQLAKSIDINSLHIHFSNHNMKMGKVLNFSLPPALTCSKVACKTCFCEGCYAKKAYEQYPNVRKAWNENYLLCRYAPKKALAEIVAYLNKHGKKYKYFRIHVSGDFFSHSYFLMWQTIAKLFPDIVFLAFTKQFFNISLDNSSVHNLVLRLSDWNTAHIPTRILNSCDYPVAYVDDGTADESTYKNAYKCSGNCAECGFCFKRYGDTVFKKH